MNVGESTLTHIITAAPDFQARLVERLSPTKAHFELLLELLDGSSKVYQLNIEAKDRVLSVKEKISYHLPAFCPQRHINFDGTFCLGWSIDRDLTVTCVDTAHSWWSHLHRFLCLQARAANKKLWPGDEWAHGLAAIHQRLAENAAKGLGVEYFKWLKLGKLKVILKQKGGARGPLLKLYLGSRHLCSVWKGLKSVANKRQPCICIPLPNQKVRRMRSCTDHAHRIESLITALYEQETSLESFWKGFKGKPCCGTMKNCPLRLGDHRANDDSDAP